MSWRLLCALVCSAVCGSVAAVEAFAVDEPRPALPALVLTQKDHGRSLTLKVGQVVEVQLHNARAGAGWESGATEVRGSGLAAVNPQRTLNCDEFVPDKDQDRQTTVGLYKYRYVGQKQGESKIRIVHLYPSGPIPMRRDATQFIEEFVVTINVQGKDN